MKTISRDVFNRIPFDPTLYLIIDPDYCSTHSPEDVAFKALQGGASLLQLRSKTTCTRDFVGLAEKILTIANQFKTPLIINDRIDVAQAIGASGVHLGQSDLHPVYARRILGDAALIGFSVSTVEQANVSQEFPIDYIGVGPVFPTTTKQDYQTLTSLKYLREICRISDHPVVAIGGINLNNANTVKSSGVAGIAVVSAVCGHSDPYNVAQELKKVFRK